MLANLYKAEGYKWVKLEKNDPLYIAHGAAAPKLLTVPLQGMSDGVRNFAIFVDGDIAGAWQMRMDKTMNELHQVMLNLRLYTAPEYDDMPTRLRPRVAMGPTSRPVTVARIKHDGGSNADGLLYEAIAPTLSKAAISLDVKDQLDATPANLKNVKLIHITGHFKFALKDSEKDAIKEALSKGAFLLIDPAYGGSAFREAARSLIIDMGMETKLIDEKSDPLFKGIDSVRPNRRMRDEFGSEKGFYEVRQGGKRVGLFSEVDISHAATGGYVYGNSGIGTLAARQLWLNLAVAMIPPPPPPPATTRATTGPATTRAATAPAAPEAPPASPAAPAPPPQ